MVWMVFSSFYVFCGIWRASVAESAYFMGELCYAAFYYQKKWIVD
jgi:hypothetical protein